MSGFVTMRQPIIYIGMRQATLTPEQRKANRKAYMDAYNKRYNEENRDKKNEQTREWQKNNPKHWVKWNKSEGAGVYCFKNLDGQIVYIGETSQIRKRKNEHKNRNKGSFFRLHPELNYSDFSFEVIQLEENEDKRKQLEQSLITTLKPRYNSNFS